MSKDWILVLTSSTTGSQQTKRGLLASLCFYPAAFASPDMYEYLEGNNTLYAMRIKANNRLYEKVEHFMTKPVSRPSLKPKVF